MVSGNKPVPMANTFRILPTYISFHAPQTKVMESKGKVYLIYIRTHCQLYPVFVSLFVLSPDMNCGMTFFNG